MVDNEIDNWLTMIGDHKCELTHIEILNRDYYRGRFASYINGRWIYNWEE